MPRRCTATASCPASLNCRTAGMRCSSARGPIVRSRRPSSLRAGTGAVRRRARRRPRAAADRQPARVPHRMARAAAHWRHRRARLFGPCAGQGPRVHGRLLAFARRGLGRCRWLRAHRRPQERHAQSRRLHARFGRGRQRADGLARRGRGHDLWQALPGAGRARARLRPPPPAPNPSTTRSGATAPSAGPATRCPKASPGARARYRGAPTASC